MAQYIDDLVKLTRARAELLDETIRLRRRLGLGPGQPFDLDLDDDELAAFRAAVELISEKQRIFCMRWSMLSDSVPAEATID